MSGELGQPIGAGCAEDQKMLPVLEALLRLENEAAELAGFLHTVENRLGPILAEDREGRDAVEKDSEPPDNLAERLGCIRGRLESSSRCLLSILDRLEL